LVLQTTNNMKYTDYILKRDVDEFKDLDWNALGKIAEMLNSKDNTDYIDKLKEELNQCDEEIENLQSQVDMNYYNFDKLVDTIKDINIALVQFKESKNPSSEDLVNELTKKVEYARGYFDWEE